MSIARPIPRFNENHLILFYSRIGSLSCNIEIFAAYNTEQWCEMRRTDRRRSHIQCRRNHARRIQYHLPSVLYRDTASYQIKAWLSERPLHRTAIVRWLPL